MSDFFNLSVLKSLPVQKFNETKPFPNYLFKEILLPEAFNELYNNFPSLDLFEKHVNRPRLIIDTIWHLKNLSIIKMISPDLA